MNPLEIRDKSKLGDLQPLPETHCGTPEFGRINYPAGPLFIGDEVANSKTG